MPIDTRKIENVQTLVTIAEKVRIVEMADKEDRTVSEFVRILLLESLDRWEKSANGRRRRVK